MFRVPGLTKSKQVCNRTVTLQEVYPTLVELAGLALPEHVDGNSLVPLLKDSDARWDHPALTAYQSHMTVRTDDYRLIRYTDGTTEFYDRGNDPNEWVNQTEKPEFSNIKNKLVNYLPDQEDMAPAIPRKNKK
jgi:arylsulfatase A-like enzyme